ncbi:hypothetical protein [Brevibacillus brevis]|uniref:hypothetical protein n=1 Tax=Brevibacillus brevis TaxID=1393 RepID=UPI001177DE34|nr:hypothetical protein [Brevibacillus brevis]
MEAKDWREEQVRNKQLARIAELEPEIAGLRDQASDIRKRFWEEVTINTSTGGDFKETYYTINQQSASLAERKKRPQVFPCPDDGARRFRASDLYAVYKFGRSRFATEPPFR